MPENETHRARPYWLTRKLYRFYQRVFLGGGSDEVATAVEEIEEDYRDVYEKHGRARAELAVLRSMAEGTSDDAKFWIRMLFYSAYYVARIFFW